MMAEAAKKMQQCNIGSLKMIYILTESLFLFCLHSTLTALRHLQDIMTTAASFWHETHSVCSELSGEKITKQVNRLLAMPEENWQKVWKSKPFKVGAVKYSSNWVAIQKVCFDFRASILPAHNVRFTCLLRKSH